MDQEDEKAFEIVAREADKARPVPPVTRKKDGFSRQDVVNSFARAFEMIGGVQRLALWANQNPDKFYPLYSRLLPSAAIAIGTQGQVIIQHAIAPTELDEHPQGSPEIIDLEPEEMPNAGPRE